MNYTLLAVACYIIKRGLQVLFEEKLQSRWCKVLIKTVTVFMLYTALASLIVWYKQIHFLGFDPGDRRLYCLFIRNFPEGGVANEGIPGYISHMILQKKA